jgi:nitric oxide reductase NorQ protein
VSTATLVHVEMRDGAEVERDFIAVIADDGSRCWYRLGSRGTTTMNRTNWTFVERPNAARAAFSAMVEWTRDRKQWEPVSPRVKTILLDRDKEGKPRFDRQRDRSHVMEQLKDPDGMRVLEEPWVLSGTDHTMPSQMVRSLAPEQPEPVAVAAAVDEQPKRKAVEYPPIINKNRRKAVELERGVHFLRTLKGTGTTDVEMLRAMRPVFSPVLLLGEAGTGKTQAVQAAYGDANIITVLGHEEVEVASMEGRYLPKELGGWEFVIGKLVEAMTEGKILFIDEIGLISPLVLSILYSAMDGRRSLELTTNPRLGTIRAKDGFFVVAATNPNAPGVRLSKALLSRFPNQPRVTTDYKMAHTHLGVAEEIADACANLDDRRIGHELTWAPQVRDLVQFVEAESLLGRPYALSALAGKAPESDSRTVCEVLSRAAGTPVKPLVTT